MVISIIQNCCPSQLLIFSGTGPDEVVTIQAVLIGFQYCQSVAVESADQLHRSIQITAF